MARRTHHSLPASTEVTQNFTPRALTKLEFGRRVQQLMLSKDWRQSDLARAAGMGRDSISKYINGGSFPAPQALKKLAEALGVTTEELLPNSLMQALEDEHPAIELRAAAGHPDKAWLRINRAVPFDVAAQIITLINQSDKKDGQ